MLNEQSEDEQEDYGQHSDHRHQHAQERERPPPAMGTLEGPVRKPSGQAKPPEDDEQIHSRRGEPPPTANVHLHNDRNESERGHQEAENRWEVDLPPGGQRLLDAI